MNNGFAGHSFNYSAPYLCVNTVRLPRRVSGTLRLAFWRFRLEVCSTGIRAPFEKYVLLALQAAGHDLRHR